MLGNRAATTAHPDYEMWLAIHDDCAWPGCDDCVMMSIEVDEAHTRLIRLAAWLEGIPEDVFFLRAIKEGFEVVKRKHGLTEAWAAV